MGITESVKREQHLTVKMISSVRDLAPCEYSIVRLCKVAARTVNLPIR